MRPAYLVWLLACGCWWHGERHIEAGMAWTCWTHGDTTVVRVQPTRAEREAA